MNRKYRRTLMVANWKMNKTPSETTEYIQQFWPLISARRRATVVLCVPAVCVPSAVSAARTTRIRIGAEDCHAEKYGAYTGEISAKMYQDAGCCYVIVEASPDNAAAACGKLRAVLTAGLHPILCVRVPNRTDAESNWQLAFVLDLALRDLPQEKIHNLIIAYEAAEREVSDSPEQINAGCAFIRTFLKERYSAREARLIPVLCACDPNPSSAQAVLAEKNVDGLLVYQTGLVPQLFADLVAAAEQL